MQVTPPLSFTPRRFGKYVLLERIGRGGMAEVYRSKIFGAAGFVKECAIKKILSSLLDDDQFVRMFVDEAKLTARLTHANIVQVLDLGEIDGHLFIAMEYVAGKDLLDVLARSARRGLRIPVELAVYVVTEMLKGLDFAHNASDAKGRAMNIVHRDVSPSNILISYDGQVKVGDFGIAKSQMQSSRTEVGTQKGKTGYMSPEQVTGSTVDRRSDLFAVGVILFEMITMTRLFKAKNDLDVMLKIRDSDIEADLERARRVSPELATIIAKSLERLPDERFQTAAEFLETLREFGQERKMKLGAQALSAYVGELFADKIADELERREQDPESDPDVAGPVDTGDAAYRYRGSEGVVHGPLTEQMMAVLLEHRSPSVREAISFDGGPWRPAHTFAEFSSLQRGKADPLTDSDEMSGLGDRARQGVADWELLAGARRGRRGVASATGDPVAVDESGARRGTNRGRPRSESVTAPHDIMGATPHSVDAVPSSARRSRSAAGSPAKSVRSDSARSTGDERTVTTASHAVVAERSASSAVETDSEPVALSSGSGVAPAIDASDGPESKPAGSAEFGDPSSVSVPGAARLSTRSSARRRTEPDPVRSQAVSETVRTLAASDDAEADLSGPLGEITLVRIAHRIGAHSLSGRLRVRKDDVSKDFYFSDGALVAADSTAVTDTLVELLRRNGKITQEQADAATTEVADGGTTLENALLTSGAIAPHELFHFIQEQLAAKLASSLFWEDGDWAWWQDREFEKDPYGATVSVDELLARSIGEESESRYFRRFYKALRRKKLVQLIPTEKLPALKLSARAMRVVTGLADTPNAAEVVRLYCDRYNWPEADVYRTLFVLTEFEVFGFEGAAPVRLPPA